MLGGAILGAAGGYVVSLVSLPRGKRSYRIMSTTGNYTVTPLEEGALFSTKRMEADSERLLPRHRASIESVLVVIDGACVVAMRGTDHMLERGDSLVIPADEWHQIRAHPEFKAIHVMPREIRFEFDR